MATTIVTKNSTVAATAPSAGQLVQGELAVNVTDRKLYTLDGGGNVVLISSGSSYDVPVVISVNSATTALIVSQAGAGGGVRITNTGAGNSLLVEDSSNPDSSPFVIDANGNVGIGTASPILGLTIKNDTGSTTYGQRAGSLVLESNNVTAGGGTDVVWSSGTLTNQRYASIGSAIEGNDGAGGARGSIAFATKAASATTTLTERMRITVNGGVSFGATGTAYGTVGQALISAGNAPPVYTTQYVSAGYVIDGGGLPIAPGIKGDITIPFGCAIIEWTLLADVAGSIVVDIWKDTYANYPPTVLDTITGSALPTITAANKGQSSTLTGWTANIAAGDTLRFNVNSCATITRVTLSLKLART
jgi:hypothetical protein